HRVIATRWVDPCLAVFPTGEWQAFEAKIRAQPLKNRDFVRLILSGAEDCDLDRQGRIYLPPHLRKYAGISRDVTLLGMGVWGAADTVQRRSAASPPRGG